MDKGILRFMAEAYLLLHAGTIAHAEFTPELTRERQDRAVQGVDSSSRKIGAKENRPQVNASKLKGGQNDESE